MMEPRTDDVIDSLPPSLRKMNSEEGRPIFHRKPVGLTITVEKIDRVLADAQAQLEILRRERTNLGIVRGQLAGMEAKWRSE